MEDKHMRELTLEEVQKLTGLERRWIQEYENYGKKKGAKTDLAIKPVKRNKYGHLLYGEKEIERLWLIRFFRELGYKKRDIEDVFSNPDFDYDSMLDEQIKSLEEKRKKLDELISVAKFLRETHIPPTFPLYAMDNYNSNFSFDTCLKILSQMPNITNQSEEHIKQQVNKLITSEDAEKYQESLRKIMDFSASEKDATEVEIQIEILIMYNILKKILGDSLTIFKYVNKLIYAENGIVFNFSKKDYSEKNLAYLQNGIDYFCTWTGNIIKNNLFPEGEIKNILPHNSIELQLDKSLAKIIYLYAHEYDPTSKEVQSETQNMIEILKEIKILPTYSLIHNSLEAMQSYIRMGQKESDNEEKTDIFLFIDFLSKSMEIYCARNHIEMSK